jgi:hypothetical protein
VPRAARGRDFGPRGAPLAARLPHPAGLWSRRPPAPGAFSEAAGSIGGDRKGWKSLRRAGRAPRRGAARPRRAPAPRATPGAAAPPPPLPPPPRALPAAPTPAPVTPRAAARRRGAGAWQSRAGRRQSGSAPCGMPRPATGSVGAARGRVTAASGLARMERARRAARTPCPRAKAAPPPAPPPFAFGRTRAPAPPRGASFARSGLISMEALGDPFLGASMDLDDICNTLHGSTDLEGPGKGPGGPGEGAAGRRALPVSRLRAPPSPQATRCPCPPSRDAPAPGLGARATLKTCLPACLPACDAPGCDGRAAGPARGAAVEGFASAETMGAGARRRRSRPAPRARPAAGCGVSSAAWVPMCGRGAPRQSRRGADRPRRADAGAVLTPCTARGSRGSVWAAAAAT